MWVRKVLIALLLALFVLSISGVANAGYKRARGLPSDDPRTNVVDPWEGTEKENNGPTTSGIKSAIGQNNSCSLIFIDKVGNIPVVFKVEVKNHLSKGKK